MLNVHFFCSSRAISVPHSSVCPFRASAYLGAFFPNMFKKNKKKQNKGGSRNLAFRAMISERTTGVEGETGLDHIYILLARQELS